MLTHVELLASAGSSAYLSVVGLDHTDAVAVAEFIDWQTKYRVSIAALEAGLANGKMTSAFYPNVRGKLDAQLTDAQKDEAERELDKILSNSSLARLKESFSAVAVTTTTVSSVGVADGLLWLAQTAQSQLESSLSATAEEHRAVHGAEESLDSYWKQGDSLTRMYIQNVAGFTYARHADSNGAPQSSVNGSATKVPQFEATFALVPEGEFVALYLLELTLRSSRAKVLSTAPWAPWTYFMDTGDSVDLKLNVTFQMPVAENNKSVKLHTMASFEADLGALDLGKSKSFKSRRLGWLPAQAPDVNGMFVLAVQVTETDSSQAEKVIRRLAEYSSEYEVENLFADEASEGRESRQRTRSGTRDQ